MEEGRRQETQSWANASSRMLVGGNPQPCIFPRFIWLASNKDREARISSLRRCAIVTIVGHLESSPEAIETTLHEAFDFEYPWKAIPLGIKTYLIEFPSAQILEKATTGKILFGSKNSFLIKKWKENIGAIGVLQKIWVRIKGLPRECWCWDDVKGVLGHFCALQNIECGDPITEIRDYVRALVICPGMQFLPSAVRVGINTKVHDVYIQPEIGQSMNPLEMQAQPSNLGNVVHGKPQFTCEAATSAGYNWREMRVNRGHIVCTDRGEPSGMNQSMSVTSPYLFDNLDDYSKKIGPSRLTIEGHSQEEKTLDNNIIGGYNRSTNECQGNTPLSN